MTDDNLPQADGDLCRRRRDAARDQLARRLARHQDDAQLPISKPPTPTASTRRETSARRPINSPPSSWIRIFWRSPTCPRRQGPRSKTGSSAIASGSTATRAIRQEAKARKSCSPRPRRGKPSATTPPSRTPISNIRKRCFRSRSCSARWRSSPPRARWSCSAGFSPGSASLLMINGYFLLVHLPFE